MFSFTKIETAPVDLQFIWTGLDKKFRKVEGEVTAKDLITAKALARSQNPGYVINKVKKKSPAMFSFGNKIKPADIAIFTRQMATMMKAGVPLVQSFDIVNQSVKNEKMKKMIRKIRDDVSGGHSLADSLRSHPDYFDDLFCSLIAAGFFFTLLITYPGFCELTNAFAVIRSFAVTSPSTLRYFLSNPIQTNSKSTGPVSFFMKLNIVN